MAEAMAAAAAAAASGDAELSDENFNATAALVSYLRMEADLAEEKARRLRAQASILAQQFGVSTSAQEAYGKSSSGQPIGSVWICVLTNLMAPSTRIRTRLW